MKLLNQEPWAAAGARQADGMTKPSYPDQNELDELLRTPAVCAELLEVVRTLESWLWDSPARVETSCRVNGVAVPVRARVAALTTAVAGGDIATAVMFKLEEECTGRRPDGSMRALIQTYGAKFGDAKWGRSRWFRLVAPRQVQEWKLTSDAPRTFWFMQSFDMHLKG